MVDTSCDWGPDTNGDAEPDCHEKRDLAPFAIHQPLNGLFLDQRPGFDTTEAEARLDAGLSAVSRALQLDPGAEGSYASGPPRWPAT